MSIFVESGLKFDFTSCEYLRTANIGLYDSLKGKNFKECDFIFVHNNDIIIMEVKDYKTNPVKAGYLVLNLAKKTIDSLAFLGSIWLNTDFCANTSSELPLAFRKKRKIKIVHVLNISTSYFPYLSSLKSAIFKKIEPYCALMDIKNVAIINQNDAVLRFPSIISVVQ